MSNGLEWCSEYCRTMWAKDNLRKGAKLMV